MPDHYVGSCRIHGKPLPCHFASFDFTVRVGDQVGFGTAEFRPDENVVLMDIHEVPGNLSVFTELKGQSQFVIRAPHLPAHGELTITRLPVVGSLVFENQPVLIGDSIPLEGLDLGGLVFGVHELEGEEHPRI